MTVEFLTSTEDKYNDFCVLGGTMPAGVYVPLHSHPDTEDLLVISGAVRYPMQDTEGYKWLKAKADDYIYLPSGTQYARRNVSSEPLVNHH